MAKCHLPNVGDLHNLLLYTPETGTLTWRHRADCYFGGGTRPASKAAAVWNGRNAGRPALNYVGKRGYRFGKLLGSVVTAHRVIWAMQTGAWPTAEIDHINGVRTDNRWKNLREVTTQMNARNRGIIRAKSGVRGVHWREDMQRWTAYITINYKTAYLGSFADIDEAIAARKSAEAGLGFTDRHSHAQPPACNAA